MIYNPDPYSEKGEFPDDTSAYGRTMIPLLETVPTQPFPYGMQQAFLFKFI